MFHARQGAGTGSNMSPWKVVNHMKIVDTSTGPAIDDSGYITMPSDTQGLMHLATLNPGIVNELLDTLSSYVRAGLDEFDSRVRLNADGEFEIPFDEIDELVHAISKSNSSATLVFQISRGMVPALSQPDPNRPTETDENRPYTLLEGYDYMVFSHEPGDPEDVPIAFYATFDLIPQIILDKAAKGLCTVHQRLDEAGNAAPMSVEELSAV